MPTDPVSIGLAILGIVAGGMLKGATGAGAPVIAVPVLAAVLDVPTAVTIFAVPNLLSNIWQAWAYRGDALPRAFTAVFAAAGLVGVVAGTFMLASLPATLLEGAAAIVVLVYVAFRLSRPGWRLDRKTAGRMAAGVGLAGGVLQGAVGVSAPISVTFLNAMRLDRATFIGTVAIFFTAMSVSQIPAQWALGLMTGQRALMGLGALALVFAGMPLGNLLARRFSADVFDKVMLGVLTIVALRLGAAALGLA
ncbi:TSUP family transporter [Rhodobacterales bacterium HKCCE3408]|nr:TSUP family transporter [Rhodobacterales bacterium HKCCE3408]